MTLTRAHRPDRPAPVPLSSASGFRRILCLAEFTDTGHAAAEFADHLAQCQDASLSLLHVTPAGQLRLALSRPGADRLLALAAGSRRQLRIVEASGPFGTTAAEILNIARRENHDLLILPAPANGAPRLLRWRPTLGAVLAAAPCPVLTATSFETASPGPILCAIESGSRNRPAIDAARTLARGLAAPIVYVQTGHPPEPDGALIMEPGPLHEALPRAARRRQASLIVTPRVPPARLLDRLRAPIPEIVQAAPCPVLHV